jgi:hypothetical protein
MISFTFEIALLVKLMGLASVVAGLGVVGVVVVVAIASPPRILAGL